MPKTSFIQKLSLHARHSLKEADDISRYTKSVSVEPEHLLLAIFLESGSLGSILLENMGFKKDSLAKACLKKNPTKKPVPTERPLSKALKDILQRAFLLANQSDCPYVGTEHLACAIMESDHKMIDDIIVSLGIDEKKITSALDAHLGAGQSPQFGRMFDLPENFLTKNKSRGMETSTFLSQFAIDMDENEDAQPTLIGRDKELARLIQILTRKKKNNPLLLGEPGVGKTALVTALAHKIETGDVPHELLNKRILSIDLPLVVAGTNFRGEFEARIKEIVKEASQNKDIILFIDEIHTLIGAGNVNGGLDAANILKPALSRGEIRCIGATTLSEYKRHIEKDPALDRRFQSVIITEPSIDEAKRILTHIRSEYESFHAVSLPTEIIGLAVDLSIRHIPDRFLPDKALDIIDEASALAKQHRGDRSLSKKILSLEKAWREAREQKERLLDEERYDEASQYHAKEKKLAKETGDLKRQHSDPSPKERTVVTEGHILKTVSQMTGIPLAKLSKESPHEKLVHLHKTLEHRLVGQDEAIRAIEQTLLRSLSDIGDPDRPLGSFLFLGPTGVGKTFAGKILAEEFFGDRSALIRLDMSEFMERHSVSQILGAPAGYVGYGEGGKLTEAVRRRPYSVVLFDEIEKAHPDVWNILLQILDEGTLTDAEGRKVSFKNTFIILTSNVGTAAFTQTAKIGFDKHLGKRDVSGQFEAIKREVLDELKKTLRPELLARLDHTIVFEALSSASIASIAALEMIALKERLKKRGIALRYPAAVVSFIAKKSLSPEQGARLIRKNVQDLAEHAIAEQLLREPQPKTIRLSVKNDTLTCI